MPNEYLYHANSSPPNSNHLLVKAISKKYAMDGSKAEKGEGYIFASGGDQGKLMGIAYSLKSTLSDGRQSMAACWSLLEKPFVFLDKSIFQTTTPTGYLYKLPIESFRPIFKDGKQTSEYVSEVDVEATEVTKIQGIDIPLEHGIQIFYLNTTKDDFFKKIKSLFNEVEITNKNHQEVSLSIINKLLIDGDISYVNKERGLEYFDLSTGEIIPPFQSEESAIERLNLQRNSNNPSNQR